MKVRESLMDGEELTIPNGISRYPKNALWMAFGWLSLFLIIAGWVLLHWAADEF